MPDSHPSHKWKTLDTDLHRITRVEHAAGFVARPMVVFGIALVFIFLAAGGVAIFFGHAPSDYAVIAAAAFGAYMAVNIGANDVANNMGPAVGARALSLGLAIAIAAICESAGALLAGGDVVATISNDIIDQQALGDAQHFIWAMLAALISAALWVNLATWVGAPVSTIHSVVGGVMGAGIASAGLVAVNWGSMGMIAASWTLSPVLGGVIAMLFLALIKSRILYQPDKIAASRVWVPILLGVMGGVFATYLALKGLENIMQITMVRALLIGIATGMALWLIMRPTIRRMSVGMENRTRSVKTLFNLPLIFSAALLSFAHGANDVANAVGPLAAIVRASEADGVGANVIIPIWVMVIGAFGISFGLFLFGPKLIRLVGSQITKLNPMRAYCVALSAAITVILASGLGLPVSSTHIAVGGVFGVGFYREWHLARRRRLRRAAIMATEERHRRKLVRRSHFMTILAAWMITVPAAATLSAILFWGMNAVFS